MTAKPAWSSQFAADAIRELEALGPIAQITREWAWGGNQGEGVRIAIIDSGIEGNHPALGDSVRSGVVIDLADDSMSEYEARPEAPPVDLFGHGTACAGIIHRIAPQAELYSVRVLGKDLTAQAKQFATGLRWAIEEKMDVVNLSLSTSRSEYFGTFHELADKAYFSNIVLVSAVNNIPVPSFPSLYSSVISGAAHEGQDPFTYYYNPTPPVEFGAPGIEIEVAWREQGYCTSTGNSFAAPHIAGIVARIRSKHPSLTPFQVKTVLFACASNTRRDPTG